MRAKPPKAPCQRSASLAPQSGPPSKAHLCAWNLIRDHDHDQYAEAVVNPLSFDQYISLPKARPKKCQ
jgi:hypothetical protein